VPLPLVYGWNGVGGDGKGAQSYIKIETNHHGIFVYPDPNRTDGWDYNNGGADVLFFDALNSYLTQNYCIDMNRIFSVGLSAGGIMSNKLGCFRGDVLRAIAPSSAMTWSGTCKGDVAVMIICGTQDTYNACDDAQNGAASETAVWVPRNGCSSQTTTSPISSMCQAYQGCAAADPVLLCTHSGGHGWPTSLSDATWQFFMGLG
jgi:polyhydroxybutyrate depolymerase